MLIDWIVKEKYAKYLNNNPQGNRLRGEQKTDCRTAYKQILIDRKLKTVNRSKKTVVTGKSPLRKHRSAFDSSAISEAEEPITVFITYRQLSVS